MVNQDTVRQKRTHAPEARASSHHLHEELQSYAEMPRLCCAESPTETPKLRRDPETLSVHDDEPMGRSTPEREPVGLML